MLWFLLCFQIELLPELSGDLLHKGGVLEISRLQSLDRSPNERQANSRRKITRSNFRA